MELSQVKRINFERREKGKKGFLPPGVRLFLLFIFQHRRGHLGNCLPSSLFPSLVYHFPIPTISFAASGSLFIISLLSNKKCKLSSIRQIAKRPSGTDLVYCLAVLIFHLFLGFFQLQLSTKVWSTHLSQRHFNPIVAIQKLFSSVSIS